MIRKEAKKTNRLTFPVRLHCLLCQAARLGVQDIISWDMTGTKFIIHKQEEFAFKVLPNLFKQTKFASFRRQLNAYGFDRVLETRISNKSNAVRIVYEHNDFKREDPDACANMTRRYSNQALIEGLERLSPQADVVTSKRDSTTDWVSRSINISQSSKQNFSKDVTFQSDLFKEKLNNLSFESKALDCNKPMSTGHETLKHLSPALVGLTSNFHVRSEFPSLHSIDRTAEHSKEESTREHVQQQQSPLAEQASVDMTDSVLDDISSMVFDGPIPYDGCASANMISWDPIMESLKSL